MEDDQEASERASERASEKEGKRLGGLRVLCRARLFIYFCFWVANALHTLDAFFLSLSLFTLSQADCRQQQAKKKKKLEMQKKQKKQKKRKKKQKRETQEEKYGRNCRRSSSSADYNASVWYKNWGKMRVCERREKRTENGEILKILINTPHIRRERRRTSMIEEISGMHIYTEQWQQEQRAE